MSNSVCNDDNLIKISEVQFLSAIATIFGNNNTDLLPPTYIV